MPPPSPPPHTPHLQPPATHAPSSSPHLPLPTGRSLISFPSPPVRSWRQAPSRPPRPRFSSLDREAVRIFAINADSCSFSNPTKRSRRCRSPRHQLPTPSTRRRPPRSSSTEGARGGSSGWGYSSPSPKPKDGAGILKALRCLLRQQGLRIRYLLSPPSPPRPPIQAGIPNPRLMEWRWAMGPNLRFVHRR
jgi:hypothetical protein